MAEETEVKVPAKRGRKPRDPNAPPKEKRVAQGRKYAVVDADKYNAFTEGITFYPSMEAAQAYADSLFKAADEEGTESPKLAFFEEAGFMEAEVVKKINRNFASSRTIVRQAASGAEPTMTGSHEATTSTSHSEASTVPTGGETKAARNKRQREQ